MDYKALICITTCNRLDLIKAYTLDYVNFCNENDEFDFLVALDGFEESTLTFCEKWNIPLIHSDLREGVGISKNRVLTQFPNYDYFFFIEDDVELLNKSVFEEHIKAFKATGIHHFSLFASESGAREIIDKSTHSKFEIIHALYGSAHFNFFTKEGLEKVGGWHTEFAKYKRYGHTEHSFRYYHAELAPAPFNVITNFFSSFAWHSPPSVTKINPEEIGENQLIYEEQEIMNKNLNFFPLKTISPFHFNKKEMRYNAKLASFLANKNTKNYPLLKRPLRIRLKSDYYFNKMIFSSGLIPKTYYLICTLFYNRNNLSLKHWLKEKLGLI